MLLFVSPAVHALTASCDVFQSANSRTEKTKIEQVGFDKSATQYQQASLGLYQSWCSPQQFDAAHRAQAVDSFVAAYAVARLSEGSNVKFQPNMALHMLAVIAMTHELPARMRSDVRLREAWMQDCQNTCFSHLTENPTSEDRIRAQYERLLRDEVLDHLQAAPGVLDVKRMLWDASIASTN
jgi:hypothetical protein